jgi:hypothetical protein
MPVSMPTAQEGKRGWRSFASIDFKVHFPFVIFHLSIVIARLSSSEVVKWKTQGAMFANWLGLNGK